MSLYQKVDRLAVQSHARKCLVCACASQSQVSRTLQESFLIFFFFNSYGFISITLLKRANVGIGLIVNWQTVIIYMVEEKRYWYHEEVHFVHVVTKYLSASKLNLRLLTKPHWKVDVGIRGKVARYHMQDHQVLQITESLQK